MGNLKIIGCQEDTAELVVNDLGIKITSVMENVSKS